MRILSSSNFADDAVHALGSSLPSAARAGFAAAEDVLRVTVGGVPCLQLLCSAAPPGTP